MKKFDVSCGKFVARVALHVFEYDETISLEDKNNLNKMNVGDKTVITFSDNKVASVIRVY